MSSLSVSNTLHQVLRHNDDRSITHDELLGTCRVLLVAGSETTATLLSGATYLLLKHPEFMDRLKSEVRSVFKNAGEITLRSVSPGRLPYLDAVLQESFRCYPPVPSTLPRITGPKGATIDGCFVPAKVR
jgi:cytochrome P450